MLLRGQSEEIEPNGCDQCVGYSSYLKEQIRTELKSSGDPVTQITVLRGAIREL